MEKFMDTFWKIIMGGVFTITVIALLAMISGFPIKWAWNCAIPGIFHLKEIGFWEAFSLSWLASAFFKASAARKE